MRRLIVPFYCEVYQEKGDTYVEMNCNVIVRKIVDLGYGAVFEYPGREKTIELIGGYLDRGGLFANSFDAHDELKNKFPSRNENEIAGLLLIARLIEVAGVKKELPLVTGIMCDIMDVNQLVQGETIH